MAARLNEIHERLIAGSRSASRDLFLASLRPIRAYLLKSYPVLREDEAHDLATDAILNYLAEPQRCNLARASLWTYLCMAAGSDAVDLLRQRQSREKLIETAAHDVELWALHANDGSEAAISHDANRIMRIYGSRLATNEPERRVLALMLDGERSVAAFADALGLDPTHDETGALVKQTKDRMLLRLRRLRDDL